MRYMRLSALLAVVVLFASCAAPAGGPRDSAASQGAAEAPRTEKTLVIALELEPAYISALAPTISGAAQNFFLRPFNAFLELIQDNGNAVPYLAEALPQLNSETWQVFPDGRMETRYTLKPNLTWHDGKPLTAADFAFAFKIATPAMGFAATAGAPFSVMEDVLAPDDRTVVIKWRALYADANVLQGGGSRLGLAPFPRHILEEVSLEESREAFQNHPYWSREFVGAGPYKLDRWELGAFIESSAFDQHVLGRPKIDHIRWTFAGDANSAVAQIRSGAAQAALNAFRFQHALQLKREWASTGAGTATFTATSLASIIPQLRPELANPPALRDVRLRKALAHGIDKVTLAETIWAGELQVMDTIFEPTRDYYPVIDRAIVKYPYDPRASERLMNELGYVKGPDGFFASPTEGRLVLDLRSTEGRPEQPAVAAGWRQVGFDTQESTTPRALALNPEARSTFPSLYLNVFGAHEFQQLGILLSSQIGSAETRWRGENRAGWANPEYDRLVEAFTVTLDAQERVQLRARIARLLTEELPSVPLTFNPNAHAYLASVKGITTPTLYTTGQLTWNIDQWDLQ